MTCNFKFGAVIGAISLVATASAAQAAQFVTNGSFANGLSIGWLNIAPDLVEVGTDSTYGMPSLGSGYLAEVNANTYGDVVQTIVGLTAGSNYTFSWYYGGRSGGGTQKLNVSFGGTQVAQDTGSIGAWQLNSYTVTATAPTALLEFKSVNTGSNSSEGNLITGVSVTGPNAVTAAVPETATWAMMIAGFAMTGIALRRRSTALRVTYG